MPDYREDTVAGTQFRRCSNVQFMNPVTGTLKAVLLTEEDVINIGDKFICSHAGILMNGLNETNGDTEFPLLDPVTFAQIGTATYAQVYAMLASLYLHTALKRDAEAVTS